MTGFSPSSASFDASDSALDAILVSDEARDERPAAGVSEVWAEGPGIARGTGSGSADADMLAEAKHRGDQSDRKC